MDQVKLDFDPPSACITLNRPQVRNALSPELVTHFHTALDQVQERDDVAALIITGEGAAFCGGADLKVLREIAAQTVEQAHQDSQNLMNFFRRIYEFPKPVIAAVNGPAIGGGCGLASVSDIVLAAEDAVFGYPEVRVGFVPALVAVFLVRICGEKTARELLLTGRVFSAQEAQEMGLVNHVVAKESLLEKAQELVREISPNSPTALRLTKEIMKDLPGLSLEKGLIAALQLNTLIRTTEDFKEGISSFLEKRRAQWKRR